MKFIPRGLMVNELKESDIQKAILEYLLLLKILAWRTNSGVSWQHSTNKKGEQKSYIVRNAPKGTADIIGILPGGRFLAIEVKKPGGAPTEAQFNFMLMVNNMGGLAFVATSTDDITTHLKLHGVI